VRQTLHGFYLRSIYRGVSFYHPSLAEGGEAGIAEVTMTTPRFDIFKEDGEGKLLWLGTANDMDQARSEALRRVSNHPAESNKFCVLDSITGRRFDIRPNEFQQKR